MLSIMHSKTVGAIMGMKREVLLGTTSRCTAVNLHGVN